MCFGSLPTAFDEKSIRHSPQATSYSYSTRQRRHAEEEEDEYELPYNKTVAVPTTSQLMVLSPNDVAFALHGGKKANTIDMGADDESGDDYELCVTVNNAPGIALPPFSPSVWRRR